MSSGQTNPSAEPTGAGPDGDGVRGIQWVFPHAEGHVTRFAARRTVIGRDADAEGRLDSAEVSRQHAEIRREGALAILTDLGSRNGTFLNGRRIADRPLRDHDIVRLGDWVGVVVSDLPPTGSVRPFQALGPGFYAGPDMQRVLEPARAAAADSSLPIIVEGETGTGKEFVARAIHEWSGRAGPFVAVNCAAIPEGLAEAELFGYRRGAFTGADRERIGFLRTGNGGTLLLDEILELPLGIQAKLLRAIERREVIPLGETAARPIDVRIVTAAQSSLHGAVERREFRADLLARLDGVTLVLPPLRLRLREVPFLFRRFLEQYFTETIPEISPRLVEQLCRYDWPFNVRELDLLSRRLATLHRRDPVLRPSHLPQWVLRGSRQTSVGIPPANDVPTLPEGRPDQAVNRSIDELAAALKVSAGNIARAARTLGISRQRAYRLIEATADIDLTRIRSSREPPAELRNVGSRTGQ